MKEQMTAQQAVDVLKRGIFVCNDPSPSCREVLAALAALEGLKIMSGWSVLKDHEGSWFAGPACDVFPTREEAEAECDRRNKEK